MRRLQLVSRAAAAAFTVLAGAASPALAGSMTVGFGPTDRPQQDTAADYIGIMDQAFGANGLTASSFSFYNATAGVTVIPLLFTLSGDTFTVTGVGQAFSSQTIGAVSDAFTLVSGSAAVGVNTYAGFESIGDTIAFTYTTAQGPLMALFVGADAVGDSFTLDGSQVEFNALNYVNDRNYSFELTAVPEPWSVAVLVVGLTGLGVVRRRRQITR
jgi:hypothetical protein